MTDIESLPLRAPGGYNVIVETPRGSRVKFAYDPETRLFRAKKLLAMGLSFPFPFGFFPSTRAGDGDPLDVMLISDVDLLPGTLVHCRLIGVIMAEQQMEAGGSEVVRNDRLLAVPLLQHQDRPPFDIYDLPEQELVDIEEFFRTYQQADGKLFEPIGRGDREAAEQLLRDSSL
ncbi:MAG TPA: inorganic diphosphatase [Devosia sp.]|jgi:inorganic pyrophosphatase|nr:inorganic diphosphatase [Devosia sp.]